MDLELLALGVLSGLRPATAQAAVIALLKAPAPRRTLLAYTLFGLAWSVAIGILIVLVFDGAGKQFGHSNFAAVFDVLAGVAALGFAAGVERAGLADRFQDRRAATEGESRIARRLRNPSVVDAALAGVVTHVPGLIYFVALNAIVSDGHGAARATVQVAIYNLLWFAIPITAFVLAIANPELPSRYLERAGEWARAHRDRLLVAVFGALGLSLAIKGTVALLQ
jgi:hypothetical protein